MKFLLLSITVATTLLLAKSGEEIVNQKCTACHIGYIPQSKLLVNYLEHHNSDFNLTAPTLTEISFAIKDRVGDRTADRESQLMEIEEFLTNYLNNPDKNRTILPKWVIKHFKTMPSMKGELSEDEIEALAEYLFDYAEEMIVKHSVRRYSYQEALKKAKAEDKIVLIEGYIPFCRGCIKMDREVFVENTVKEALNRDFVLVKKNVLIEHLPLGLKSLGTPSFYFITNDGKKVIDAQMGTGTVDEFLALLNGVKERLKRGEFIEIP